MQKQLQAAGDVIDRLLDPASLLQIVVILLMGAAGWVISGRIRRNVGAASAPTGWRGRAREAAWVAAPFAVILLLLAAADGMLHALRAPARYVDVAVQLTALLLLIRVAIYALRVSLGTRSRIKGWGAPISIVIWVFLSLHLLGWGDELITALDSIGFEVGKGKTRISVWSVTRVLVTVSLFIVLAVWLSRWLERRVMSLDALAPNMRIGLAKFTQAFLIGLSVLIGLNAAGLDLTTLTVLTGAIGIGLGFGLQSITANLVGGFVLLMDRSIKPGDVISFTGTTGTSTEGFGWVQQLRGRYVVIRDRDGVETLVPNQNLITNTVINWSYTDPRVRLKLPVRISYNSDPELALRTLIEATDNQRRVLRDPPPVARLMNFGDHGIELELRFWIADPQEGVNNVRSDVNRTIWRLFKERGIKIPVAQREVRLEMAPSGLREPAEGT